MRDSNESRWELSGLVYEKPEYAKKLKKELSREVDCGKGAFLAVKGTKLKCKVEGKPFVVTFTNDEGGFRFVEP